MPFVQLRGFRGFSLAFGKPLRHRDTETQRRFLGGVGEMDSRNIRDKSLEQLGAVPEVVPQGESHVVSELRRLRAVPLKALRLEDLRFLIGQSVGLEYLIPIALDHLEVHPLASGDFYHGDLLKNVMDAPESFWIGRPELRLRLIHALELGVERIHRVDTVSELEAELDAGLKRHEAALTT